MFKHNLILAFRNFLRYKSSFLINLIGLTSGLACTLFIYLWVSDELNINKFHEKGSQLYQVMEHQQYAEDVMTTVSTPGLLANELKENYPEVEYAATTSWIGDYTLSLGDKNVQAEGYHVGKDFFNIFSYGLVQGDADQVLAEKYSIVISEELAENIFGTKENVIGKTIELQHKDNLIVSGVFKGTPKSSSYQFDFVMSFEFFLENNSWALDWGSNGPSTFVILQEDTDPTIFNSKIASIVSDHEQQSNVTVFVEPYANRYLYGRFRNGKPAGGRIEYVRLFTIIALFILVIACINFMNLSTARASRRAKEVGLKKAIGAQKGSLISQYLGESMLISLFSTILALLFVWLGLPIFNEITTKHLELQLDSNLIIVSAIIVTITGLVAGSYPALYLSGFQVVTVLKGEMRGSFGELWARRGLVIFQFTLSIILIVSVLVIYKQISFVQNTNLGYKKDNLIYFEANGRIEEQLESFLAELNQLPGVKIASGISHSMLGRQNNTSGLSWEGKDPDSKILFENVGVNYDMIETLAVEMAEGRTFSREFSTDSSKLIFNETAIKIMGLEDPIGKVVKRGDRAFEIIGVVKDFHFQSLHSEINPLFFRLDSEYNWKIMTRIEAGKEQEAIAAIKDLHTEFNPGFAFDYRFQDEQYAKLYSAEMRVATLSQYFAGFAILISCLGLFGLAAFTAERRIKEIGIRKALGSTATNIVFLLSKDFTRMVLISICIGLPISYYITSLYLEKFAFHIELKPWFFVASGIIALLISWFTVGYQAVKSANTNPAECLKDE
jgi:putative ABC transport system permease protein